MSKKNKKLVIEKQFNSVFNAKEKNDNIMNNSLIKKVMEELAKT